MHKRLDEVRQKNREALEDKKQRLSKETEIKLKKDKEREMRQQGFDKLDD